MHRRFNHLIRKVLASLGGAQPNHRKAATEGSDLFWEILLEVECPPRVGVGISRGHAKRFQQGQASVHVVRYCFSAQAADERPPLKPLLVDGQGHDAQAFGQTSRPHRAVDIQEVVVFSRFQVIQDFACAALDDVTVVQPGDELGSGLAFGQANEINDGIFPKMVPHRSDHGLHKQHIAQCAESRNQESRRRCR